MKFRHVFVLLLWVLERLKCDQALVDELAITVLPCCPTIGFSEINPGVIFLLYL